MYAQDTEAEDFFILLIGQVTVLEKNREIDQWDWANKVYKTLETWKNTEFKNKVKTERQFHVVGSKL